MEKVAKRATRQAALCMASHVLKVQSCVKCQDKFREIVSWLQACIDEQHCYRTASVLCSDGKFKLYQIKD